MERAEADETDTFVARAGQLSPQKRRLLEQRLRARTSSATGLSSIPRRQTDEPRRLSAAQKPLLLLQEANEDFVAYNVAQAHRITGPLDLAALRAAIDDLYARHEVLRSRFSVRDGEPSVDIAPVGPCDVRVTDLAATDISDFVSAGVTEPFDLHSGRLLRARIGVIAPDDHVLVLSTHHIVSDADSKAVLNRELAELYRAHRDGRPAELAPVRRDFADFAAWEASRIDAAEELRWWRTTLTGAPEQNELPTDRNRPPTADYRGEKYSHRLGAGLVAEVAEFGRTHRATTFMVLLAAYAGVLRRYGTQDDIVIGSPTSGRHDRGLADMVGLFLTMLPLRLDTSGDPSFAELVARARQVATDAYRHQSVAFDRIVEAVRPPRVRGRNPIFQTMFTLKQGTGTGLALDGLTATPINYEGGWTKFDLTVVCTTIPDGMAVLWQYATTLFDRDTVVRLATHFERLLRAGLAKPDLPLSALSLADADDVAAIEAWNDTERADEPTLVLDLIAEHVRRQPDAPAVGDARTWLTFRELDERANQLAHHLVSLGVGPDRRVAIYLERSVELEVALLAVLKAGGAYVPLDTGYPADRLKFMVDDCNAVALLTTAELAGAWSDFSPVVVLDDIDLTAQPTAAPDVSVAPGQLAYVLYTSGTTGRPKGVQIEHGAIANQIDWMRRDMAVGAHDTILQKTPISFDVAGWEVLLAPCAGARLFMARPMGHLDPDYLIDVVEQQRVTVINFVPSMLEVFLDRADVSRCASLRLVIVAGEALPDETKDECLRALPDAQLWNIYGPTETAIGITVERCLPEREVTIGVPGAGCQGYVLDSAFGHQPVGMPGELFLGGRQLARGYLDRPELTAERFVDTEHGRLYRTGDRAAWRPDGRIAFLGRLDEQVKLRGFRIELSEIESVLASSPGVQAACATISASPAGIPMLSAYVTMRSGLVPTPGREQVTAAVERWRATWDETYRSAGGDPTFDVRFPARDRAPRPPSHHELREWVGATADRVAALSASSILDVGAGAGALMWRLAPRVQRYEAVDFAANAIDRLQTNAHHFDNATVQVQAAHELAPPIADRRYDCVVLNSVAQYFPDEQYLHDVLTRARAVLTDGGTVFVGDVRDLRLQDAAPLEALQAAGPITSAADVRAVLDDIRLGEDELLLHPALFATLPGVEHVQVLPRRGRLPSEMNRFRYDVVLHTAPDVAVELDEWLPWTPQSSLDWLSRTLAEHDGAPFGVLGIPNGRVAAVVAALDDLADGRLPELASDEPGVDPEELIRLGTTAGYQVERSCARERGLVDVAFTREGKPVRFPDAFSSVSRAASNEPLLAAATLTTRATLATELDSLVRDRLPDYMVPTTIRVLHRFPLTPSGKLDRRALSELKLQLVRAEPVPPRTETERRLARIWQKALKLSEPISVDDNFFDLGGSSLLALSLFPMIEQEFGLKLPVAVLFEHTTVAEVSAWIDAEAGRRDEWDLVVAMRKSGHKRPLFLMPSQRGDVLPYMQLVDAIDPDRPVYGIQCVGLDGRQAPRTTIEEVAADCVSAIRKVQPDGPYLIGGYCFGGVVAFEVAGQLIAAGEQVDYCGLIDATPFGRGAELMAHLKPTMRRRLTWNDSRELRRKIRYARSLARWRLDFEIGQLCATFNVPIPRRFVDVLAANRVAAAKYVTPDVPVKVTFFRAASGSAEADELRRQRWEKISGGVEMHVVSGYLMGHWQIVRAANVPRLAPLFDKSLAHLP